jgi:hypothetical protein
MRKTVLLVAYYFPPLGMGGVQRMAKLAKYLPDFGYDVVVLTVKPIRYAAVDPSLLQELPAEVAIFRSGSRDPARIGRFLPFVFDAGSRAAKTAKGKTSLLWPDSKIGWKGPALRLARRIMRSRTIDIVLSSSPPITAHLVAMQVHRECGIPWVVDFRDFWESRPPEDIYASADRAAKSYDLLREIVASADGVTRVNDSIHPDLAASAMTIMGGYDPADFELVPDKPAVDRFTFCHLGTVGPLAPMEPFLAAGRRAGEQNGDFRARVRFLFIGVNDDRALQQAAVGHGLAGRVESCGYLPHREALRKAASAQVSLIGIPDRYPGILPGKIFDYLALPGPILAACPQNSEIARLINRFQAGIQVESGDNDRLADAMLRLFVDHANGVAWNKGDISRFTRREAAGQFAQTFDRLLKR